MGSRWNKGTRPGAFCEHLEVIVILVNKEMRQGNTPLFCLKWLEDDYSFNLKTMTCLNPKDVGSCALADSDCSLEHFYTAC